MISDNLMLNDDKTEFLILGTKQQIAKVNIDNIKVGSANVSPVPVVRNLGSWFDLQLTMSSHISNLLHFTTCVIFDAYTSIYLKKPRRR